jgi:hypothetical protein
VSRRAAVLASSLLLAPAVALAERPALGSGLTGTAGTGGYRAMSLFADAGWKGNGVDPYGWGDVTFTRDSRRLSLLLGAEKELGEGWLGHGGGGFSVGKLYDTGDSSAALLAEAGAEKRFKDDLAAGADWRMSAGSIGGRFAALGEDGRRRGRALRRGLGSDTESFSYNELSVFGRLPVEEAWLTLRLALGISSYGEDVVSESATLRLPVKDGLAVLTGITLEHADDADLYFTAGLYYAW